MNPFASRFATRSDRIWRHAVPADGFLLYLAKEPVELSTYRVFFRALGETLQNTLIKYHYGADLGEPYEGMDPNRFFAVLAVSRQLAPRRVAQGVNVPGWSGVPIRTWADFADEFREAMVKNGLAGRDDAHAYLHFVRFAQAGSLRLGKAGMNVLCEQHYMLANRFIELVVRPVVDVMDKRPEVVAEVAEEPEVVAEDVVMETG